jgi:hypothetical protein
MAITCFIRYEIDPFQRESFKEYATKWADIIPRCGGNLVGYFLPYENFAMAQTKRLILREERTFVEVVDGTLNVPAKGILTP